MTLASYFLRLETPGLPACYPLTILLGFLLPWTWGISSRLLQQSTAAAPYLEWRYLLTASVPDLQLGIAPLVPPVPAQPPLLGLLLPAAGPGLRHAVASPGGQEEQSQVQGAVAARAQEDL